MAPNVLDIVSVAPALGGQDASPCPSRVLSETSGLKYTLRHASRGSEAGIRLSPESPTSLGVRPDHLYQRVPRCSQLMDFPPPQLLEHLWCGKGHRTGRQAGVGFRHPRGGIYA